MEYSSWFTPTVLFCLLNFIIICLFIASYSKSHKQQLGQHDSPHLTRSSSLLARVKSINFSFRNLDHHYPETLVTDPQDENHVSGEVTPEDAPVPATTENKLSLHKPLETMSFKEKKEEVATTGTSVKERKKKKIGLREAVKTVSFKGDEEVDAKADDFITKFKQQLKMQRIDSIKRYTDMLTGGARSTN